MLFLNQITEVKDSKIFTPDGHFAPDDKILLMLNSILTIIYAFSPGSLKIAWLRLELLRCGIYIEMNTLQKVIARMIEEGSIHHADTGDGSLNMN